VAARDVAQQIHNERLVWSSRASCPMALPLRCAASLWLAETASRVPGLWPPGRRPKKWRRDSASRRLAAHRSGRAI